MNRVTTVTLAVFLMCGVLNVKAANFKEQPYIGYGSGFTISGAGQKVTSASALASAAKSGGKITVSGKISGDAVIVPASGTHIVGDGTAELERVSFYIGSKNVTIQNISMRYPCPKGKGGGPDHDGDLIHIEGSGATNIWIDHCDLSADFDGVDKDKYDGLIDVKNGPGSITISWNFIHDAHKTSLVGHTDKDNSGPWQLSIHHNIFNNVGSRIPSLRGGKAAVFNNYYIKVETTAINSRLGAEAYCEKNYFDGVGTGKIESPLKLGEGPIGTWYSDNPGKYNVVDNYYIRCLGNQPKNSESTTSYKPSFMNNNSGITPVMDVPKVLLENAGVGGKSKKLKLPEGHTHTYFTPNRSVKYSVVTSPAVFNILGEKVSRSIYASKTLSNSIYITKANGKSIVNVQTVK